MLPSALRDLSSHFSFGHKRFHIQLICPTSEMELGRLCTMFITTFVTVLVISLFILTSVVALFPPPQLNPSVEDCYCSVVQIGFYFVIYIGEGFEIMSACSISGYLLIFQLNWICCFCCILVLAVVQHASLISCT